jgi:drug/metabolite transporter (DMT)-like permease
VRRATWKGDGILLLAAVIWGGAFVAQRTAMQHIGPFLFNGVRFALGALVLLPLIRFRAVRLHDSRRAYLLGGAIAGLVLFAGASLQQAGLVHTTAGKAGFITGLYVVLVPILGIVVGYRAPAATWAGAALACTGLYLLSVSGDFTIERGDGLVLACAGVWAVHVLLIGWLSPRTDPVRLAAMQFAMTAVLSLAAACVWEPLALSGLMAAGGAILYGGLLSVGVGYTLQVVGQRQAPPAHAGILLSLEAVFALLAGWVLLAESLTTRQLLGCGLMLTGILASQLRPAYKAKGAASAAVE